MASKDVRVGLHANYGTLVDAAVDSDAIASAAVTKAKLGTGFLKVALINGGAAGNHTVTGIATADALVTVLHLPDAGAVDAIADLTAEFTISANTINNTGGTASTNGKLLVIYQDRA